MKEEPDDNELAWLAGLTCGKPKVKEYVRKPPKPKEKPPVAPATGRNTDKRDAVQVVHDFFCFTVPFKAATRIFVGIDTGKKGAIGLLCPDFLEQTTAIDIPMTKAQRSGKTAKGNKRYKSLYDEGLIWEIFKEMLPFSQKILVGIEETAPRETDRGRTGHAMGYGLGMWPLFLRSHGFSFDMVLPAIWKRKMSLCGKDKEWSRLMAQRLWPSAPLLRKGDDGRAEALLIAEYFKRKDSGGN